MLPGGRAVVRALAIGEIARMAERAFFVAFHAVNRFTVRAAAGLLLFWVRHRD
jgi:hypothetical protein